MPQELVLVVFFYKTATQSLLSAKNLQTLRKDIQNIECELLALVIVVEHLHHYVFGRQFTIHTDHAPLVNLFNKCLNDTSPRLQ